MTLSTVCVIHGIPTFALMRSRTYPTVSAEDDRAAVSGPTAAIVAPLARKDRRESSMAGDCAMARDAEGQDGFRLAFFATLRSLTSILNKSSPSSARSTAEGWMVTTTAGAHVVSFSTCPRACMMRTSGPSSDCAAVDPMQTTQAGLMARSSASIHGRHARISEMRGFLWMRRFPRSSKEKCFTAFVR